MGNLRLALAAFTEQYPGPGGHDARDPSVIRLAGGRDAIRFVRRNDHDGALRQLRCRVHPLRDVLIFGGDVPVDPGVTGDMEYRSRVKRPNADVAGSIQGHSYDPRGLIVELQDTARVESHSPHAICACGLGQ